MNYCNINFQTFSACLQFQTFYTYYITQKSTIRFRETEIKYIAFHSIKSGQSANFMAEFTRNVRLLLSDYFRFRHETAISFRVNLNKNLGASEGPPP